MDTLPGGTGPARCLGDGGVEGTAGCRGRGSQGEKGPSWRGRKLK